MSERTSRPIATIAGRIVGLKVSRPYDQCFYVRCRNGTYAAVEWSDIRALAASALTQRVPDYKSVGPLADVPRRLTRIPKRRARRK